MKLTNLKDKGQVIGNPNDREIFNRYLREISKFQPLSREEEQEVFKKYKETNDPRLKEKLCKHNLLFVVSVAKRYGALIPYSTLTLEDLVNEGNLGLCLAVDKFDHESGNKFISYAVWWIRQQILASIQDNFKTIRLPSNVRTLIRKLEQKECELEQKLGREITTEDLYHELIDEDIKALGSTHAIDELFKMNSFETSLNKRINVDESTEKIELIQGDSPTPHEIFELEEKKKILDEMLSKVPKYVRDYFTDYYGLDGGKPLTLVQMAEKYERSNTGIKEIMKKYMRRIRYNNKNIGKLYFPTPDYAFERFWRSKNKDHENTTYLL
jgi:RNA polymerase primary sigma factor